MPTDANTPAKPGVHARGCKGEHVRPARWVPHHVWCPDCRRHVRITDDREE